MTSGDMGASLLAALMRSRDAMRALGNVETLLTRSTGGGIVYGAPLPVSYSLRFEERLVTLWREAEYSHWIQYTDCRIVAATEIRGETDTDVATAWILNLIMGRAHRRRSLLGRVRYLEVGPAGDALRLSICPGVSPGVSSALADLGHATEV